MPENPLEVRLELVNQRPNYFTLTSNSVQYPLTLNPEANVTFSDWLRRLRPLLVGRHSGPFKELPTEGLLHDVGIWLWQALLPDSAPTQQRDSLAQALRSGRTPLLLTLPETLAELPWELLCDPGRPAEQGFIARRRPLIRFIPSDVSTPAIQPPLRVLLLVSSPLALKEESRVDVESERAGVEQATREMREAGLLHLLVEDIVAPKRVQQLLMRFKPHIVHYIGHGGYYEKTGGVLLWEDERGDILPVSGARLADILRPHNVTAVILHACETGKSNTRSDVHSIADILIKEGISAVLAQQASFTYESSLRASDAWYTALTAGQGLAEALFEVRQALLQAGRPDWAVPILQANATSLTPVLDTSAPPGSPDPLLTSQGSAADLSVSTGIFVGRHHELRALRLMLENLPGSGPVLALITGPRGIGKSTLVAQAVTRYGGKYKAALTLNCLGYQDAELFLQLIGEFLKRQGAPSFLEQTLPDPKLSTTAKIEEAIVVFNQAGPFLLIVDNLERVQNEDQTLHDEGLLYLLQKLLTNLHGGRVLITGRYTVKNLLPDGKFAAHLLRLDLDDLSPYETSQLLTRHPSLARLSETVHQTLINEFGGLPYVYDLLSSDAASQSLDLLIHNVQGRITEERNQRTAQQWQEVRQRIIEFAVLEATVNHLSMPSRTLLARLGVLQRPFPLAAIEQGLEAACAEWQPLLDWSLLHYDPLEQTYRLHGITRHYVKELLNEQDRKQTQAKLASWYEYYVTNESHDLADYLEAHRLWRASGDVRQAGELVIQIAEPLRRSGLYSLLREICMKTLTDLGQGDERLIASTRYQLGNLAYLQGKYEEAREFYQQNMQIYERLGDQSGRANTLYQLGMIAQDQEKYEEAREFYQQSLEIKERLGDQSGQAQSLHQLGNLAYLQGKYEEAREFYQQSLEIKERLGDQSGRAISLHQLGMIAQQQENYQEAQRFYLQSLEIFERLGEQYGRANSLGQLGTLAYVLGEFEKALRYAIRAFIVFDALHSPSRITVQQLITSIRRQMDEATFTEHWKAIAGDLPLPDFSAEDVSQDMSNFSAEDASQQILASSAEDVNQQIMQTLVDFVQAPTWEDSRRLLESHPELLQPEIDAGLKQWAMQQENESAHQSLEQYRALLARCRDMGIDVAFADLRGVKSPEAAFVTELNSLCSEVVTTLRAGNVEQQQTMATQLEQTLEKGFPVEGAKDFVLVLVAWLRKQETQTLAEKLQPMFRNAYDQMVTVVEQAETESIGKDDELSVEDLPGVVSSVILTGTAEQRQQVEAELVKAQQQVMLMEPALGKFFECLASALRGGTPEAAALKAPYTDLWQEFQDALAAPSDQQDQQQQEKHD